jgi:hypothetical protein
VSLLWNFEGAQGNVRAVKPQTLPSLGVPVLRRTGASTLVAATSYDGRQVPSQSEIVDAPVDETPTAGSEDICGP